MKILNENNIEKMAEEGLDMTTLANFQVFFENFLKRNLMILLVKKKETSTLKEFIHFFQFLKSKHLRVEISNELKGLVLQRLLLSKDIVESKIEIENIQNWDQKLVYMNFILDGLKHIDINDVKNEYLSEASIKA